MIKQGIKHYFSHWIFRKKVLPARMEELKSSLAGFAKQPPAALHETGYDIFTDQGEDGIIQYLLSRMQHVPASFVDIGAGDAILSNCTALAVHEGWKGWFIDADRKKLSNGKKFYHQLKVDGLDFISEKVTPINVNALLEENGCRGQIGLLSIDIDGNDYWVWKAIQTVQPRLVVIEAKVEFGPRNIVVPFSDNNSRTVDIRYNGASVEALRLLGGRKGYKLVGANRQGYNLFFVKENEEIPEATKESVLADPETVRSFYPETFFSEHSFVTA